MATSIISCVICYSESEDTIVCLDCKTGICLDCLKNYKKLECPSCFQTFSDAMLKPYYNDNKELYINYYIFKHIKYTDESNQKIIKYFQDIEIKKNIYWGKKVHLSGNKATFTCKKCFAVVLETGICISCKYRICLQCREEYHEGKKCDENILTSMKEIKNTCKQCPSCLAYIFRSGGCPHMNCTYCGASFNWHRSDVIEQDQYAYKKIQDKPINPELNSQYVKKYQTLYAKKQGLKYVASDYENIQTFIQTLNRDYKKNIKTIETLSVEYFLMIRTEFEKHQEEELSQIDFNYTLDKKFMYKLFLALKRNEYYQEINNRMVENIHDTVESLEKIFNVIQILFIIPNELLFFFDKDHIEIKNNKLIYAKKKPIEEIKYVEDESIENQPIELLNEEQEFHVKGVLECLKMYNLCLNTSHAGSGKTYTSLYIANELNIKNIILFFPKIMQEKWISVISKYNQYYKFNILYFTYSEITSIGFTTNNNAYSSSIKNNKLTLVLKDELLDRIASDSMILLDEVHNIKSPSSKAFKFIETVCEQAVNSKAYILALSATPIEKKSEISQLSRKISLLEKFEILPLISEKYIVLNYPYTIKELKLRSIEMSNDDLLSMTQTPTSDYRVLKLVFKIMTKNVFGDYNTINRNLNSVFFRNKKNTITQLLLNYKKYSIDIDKILEGLLEYNNINEDVTILPEVIKYLEEQKNFKIYFTLLHNYLIYLHQVVKKKSQILESTVLLSTILVLFGCKIKTVVLVVSYIHFNVLVDNLRENLFNLKTFNIDKYLQKDEADSHKNVRFLEIGLTMEDRDILDSAFKQVFIEINTDIASTTLEALALITKGLMISERLYINYLINIILTIYERPIKIIIGLHFRETMKVLRDMFTDLGFKHIYIDGSITDKQSRIDEFQNSDTKLLLLNMKAVNSGVDLDDKIGDCQRVVFIIPDFKFSKTIQFMYRFNRVDSKSIPHIFIIHNHIQIIKVLLQKNNLNQKLKTTIPNLGSIDKIHEDKILSIMNKNK